MTDKKSIGLFFGSDNNLSIAWYVGDICKMTEIINLDTDKNPHNKDFLLFIKRINPHDICFYAIAPWLKKKHHLASLLKIQTLKMQINNACIEIPLKKAQTYFTQKSGNSLGSFFNAKAITFYGIHHKIQVDCV